MNIGLVGPTYQQNSLPFNAERSVNLYGVKDKRGKDVAALYGTPGYNLFATAGTGPVRQEFFSTKKRGFVVSGSTLYEINSGGTVTSRGSLNQSSGIVYMVENTTQLAICDGTAVYIFTYATNAFVQVTDIDLPISGTLTFIDGYFIVNKVGTGTFYISKPQDGLVWETLDFATAESSPDNLLRVINALGTLFLLGDITSEIWNNTGASSFPFQRIAGAKMDVGILAPDTALPVDGSLYWLGKDDFGTAIVYKSKGIVPVRVSTEPIELIIQRATDKENIRSYAYQQQGHLFIVYTGGGLETTLVYDTTTDLWHERAWLNPEGNYEQHRGAVAMFAFGKHLIGDRENGNIYEMDMDIYTDNGDAILRERVYTHLCDENKRIPYNKLRIGFETGVGTQEGLGENPVCALSLSKDGARTYSDSYTADIGAAGKYLTNASFRRLGIAEQMTFRLRISAPVKVAICGSYLE